MTAKHTVVVTGGAGGIGGGFVSEFLQSPRALSTHAIYVVHPSAPGTLAQLLEKRAPASHTYEIVAVDLASLASIRAFAAGIKKRVAGGEIPAIRALFLIAGGIFTGRGAEAERAGGLDYSADGLEKMFAVNYLANFLLVLLLLGSMDYEAGRIVFMSSTTHWPAHSSNVGHIRTEEHKVVWKEVDVLASGAGNVPDAGSGKQGRFEAAMRRYGTTKTLMNLFMYGLQSRLAKDPKLSKISIVAMEPGAVGGTGLFALHTFPIWMWFILCYIVIPIQWIAVWFMPNGFLRTPRRVGKDLVFAGWNETLTGATYLDGMVVRDSSPETHDVAKQRKLWEGSLRLAGVEKGESILEV